MATQITATLPTLDFPREADYPKQEDWAEFSAVAEENYGILSGSWSEQMQLWKDQANAMSTEFNNNSTIAQGLANYQGDWISQGYTLGQTVSVSGIYYICKLTHATGQNPTVGGSLYWNLALGNWNLKVNTDMSDYSSKTTPADDDLFPLSDSAATFGIKKLSWVNLKASLGLIFVDLLNNQTISGIKTFTSKILSPGLSYKDTPVTVSSWSYATTTITLNVASHAFVAGDYIEVSRLTSSTYPANGIQLVTSVTGTTIVFTQAVAPTGTAGVSSATVKGYATINGRVAEGIGIAQTWKDVTSSRVSGTTYTNPLGKPITIKLSATGQNCNNIFVVNGVTLPLIAINGTAGTASTINDMCIVPANGTYSATITGASIKWFELS